MGLGSPLSSLEYESLIGPRAKALESTEKRRSFLGCPLLLIYIT
jgi:hypothetical protein